MTLGRAAARCQGMRRAGEIGVGQFGPQVWTGSAPARLASERNGLWAKAGITLGARSNFTDQADNTGRQRPLASADRNRPLKRERRAHIVPRCRRGRGAASGKPPNVAARPRATIFHRRSAARADRAREGGTSSEFDGRGRPRGDVEILVRIVADKLEAVGGPAALERQRGGQVPVVRDAGKRP
jgi:hypothetical protein